MARGKDSAGSEYNGTQLASSGNGGTISGPSEPLDPDAAAGTGGTPGAGERDSAGTEFDASTHTGNRNANGTWERRRGRKRGHGSNSGPRPKASKADLNNAIDALTKTLVIVHAGIAGVTKMPELVIDDSEGRMLAAAAANVLEEFDLKPDPKTQAIVGLVIAGATVYGPRAVLIQMRRAQEKAEKQAGAGGNGTAGVYGPNGEAMGTTDFTVHEQPAEFTFGDHRTN